VLTSQIYRRLLIETALTYGYLLRLEQRTASGRSLLRIAQPVALDTASDSGPGGLLRLRVPGRLHEFSVHLEDIHALSLAIEHLPAGSVARGRLMVGDAVRHDDLGFGVLQSFGEQEHVAIAHVIFTLHGEQDVEWPETSLQLLDSRALGQMAGAGRRPSGKSQALA
jgi:hypothetical protein